MTYAKFHLLRTQATMCTDLSDYIHQNTALVRGEFEENSVRLLKAVWELANNFEFSTLVRVSEMPSVFFTSKYGIHPNTISQWKTGKRKPQDYLIELLAADTLSETFCV